MKSSEISQTPIIKRFGVRGAKFFAKIWLSMMYLALVAVSAGFWVAGPEFAAGWRRIFVGCFVGALVVVGASLLTRMRLKFLAEIAKLEARGKMA